ncbi:class I SAM-dependent methyltransferase [Rivularia sp. UHCC 0363]|uniref:class I SAM-dependent methyltransferase n=1 Tax=Rivularia sp. UHCC 0363 TaxID=3110244 RepID=UPI002B21A105|nr:methyltransferase domain-containing protein [Rivularia sp. UHCC 0363]MEA5597537.1 methyltransferase domain-containing protein [Rivularia sp. UHCC 0363]
MIESNEPEINVDELMQKIREEVAKHKENHQINVIDKGLVKPLPKHNVGIIEALLKNAEIRAFSRAKMPDKYYQIPFFSKLEKLILKIFNLLFKDQRQVNFNLIQALQESVSLNRNLLQRCDELNTRINDLEGNLGVVDSYTELLDENLNFTKDFQQKIHKVNASTQRLEEKIEQVNAFTQGLEEKIDRVNASTQGLEEKINKVNASKQELEEKIHTISAYTKGLEQQYLKNNNYLKADLVQQKRLITLFLEEARQRLPEPFNEEQLQTFVNEQKHALDDFYFAFEEQFRGSRDEIKNRLATYIPFVEKAVLDAENAAMLDIGCGRGEWIELVSNKGFKSYGVDISHAMVAECQNLGLNAVAGDALQHLRSLPDNSLAVVSAFHIIEHLPLEKLIFLIDESLRVLHPGGILILETPNPENLIVGACNFYFDPTHRNPIPPATTKFMLENRGFSEVEVHRLDRSNQDHNLDNSFLNTLLLRYEDYAVIGWKL